jgi:phosphate transport system substrate-binding protein
LAKLEELPALTLMDDPPNLDGATALYPVYASFVNAVYPVGDYPPYNWRNEDSVLKVLCSTTPDAYTNLLEKKADIIFCAKPSEEQRQQFIGSGLKLNLIPIGKEAFVFFVNKENPVSNLTVKDIQGIYSGIIKNWKELGGKPERIKAFQRSKNSGSQTALENIMVDIPIIKPPKMNIASGMGDVINEVADYRNFGNAIGYSFLYFSTQMVKNNQIKLLSINGIYPSKETIQNGSYPFSDNFYAIYVDDGNENIKLFIQWILSDQGQELIEKTGYIPILKE